MRAIAGIYILGLLMLASCSQQETPRIAWSKTVDSLLHDSVPLHAYADSFRVQVLNAGSDSAAVRALACMAEFLPSAVITAVADDAAAHCPKDNKALLADIRCKQGIGLFKRQKSDSAAQLFRESLSMARKLSNPALETQALCWLGDYYRLSYKFDSCESTLTQAIQLTTANKLFARSAHARTFIGDLYRITSKYDTASIIYNLALTEARQGNDASREGFILTNIGDVFRLRNNVDSALFYFNKALVITGRLNDNSRRGFVLVNQGDMYRFIGKNPDAMRCYNSAIDAAEKAGDKRRIAHCHVSMADLYSGQRKFDKALPHLKKALSISSEIGEKQTYAWAMQAAGETYRKTKQTDSAIFCFQKSIATSKEINHSLRLAGSLIYLSDLFVDLKQYDSAFVYAKEGLKVAEENEDPSNIGEANRIISVILTKKGKHSEALPYALEALRIGKENSVPWLISGAANTLSEIQVATGDYKNAFENHILFVEQQDSIEGKEQFQRLAAAEYEAKESTLKAEQARKEATLESDKARQQQQIERQRFLIWIAVGGAVLLGGLLFVALRAYRSKQRANLIIAEQKQQVEAQKLLVEVKNKEVMDSITYARRLQEAILPRTEHIQQVLPESFVLYLPKDVVAGDFYFFVERGSLLFLAAADCTGHGVPGALVSVVCSNALKRAVNEFQLSEPGEILDKTTELVLETFSQSGSQVNDGMDITLLVIDRNTSTCKWSGANRPLWIVTNGQISQLKGDARPVGHHDDPLPFTTHQPDLNAGSMIYLFSDGYADQFGGTSGKKFKTRQLQDVFLKIAALPANEQKQELESTFQNWKNNFEQVDDVCVIGLRLS